MRQEEIIRLWHIARVAGHESRFDRMQYVKREYLKAHPEESPKQLWRDIDYYTRAGIPVTSKQFAYDIAKSLNS